MNECQMDANCPYPPVVTVRYRSSKKRCCAVHRSQLFDDPGAYAQHDPFAEDKDEGRGDPGDALCCRCCNGGPLREETNKTGLCSVCCNKFDNTRRHWRIRHGLDLTVEMWLACGGHPSGKHTGPRTAFWKHSPAIAGISRPHSWDTRKVPA